MGSATLTMPTRAHDIRESEESFGYPAKLLKELE